MPLPRRPRNHAHVTMRRCGAQHLGIVVVVSEGHGMRAAKALACAQPSECGALVNAMGGMKYAALAPLVHLLNIQGALALLTPGVRSSTCISADTTCASPPSALRVHTQSLDDSRVAGW